MSKPEEIIKINDSFNVDDEPMYIKSYMFIKGFAIGSNLNQTVIALSVARRLHDGQYRKDGLPYIVHPLKVCSTLIACGITDDATLSASLLHDVLEDCSDKLPLGSRTLTQEFQLSQEVVDIITLLTKEPGMTQHELSVYFNNIKKNPKALLVKLSDRLHNSCTLSVFTYEKAIKYLKETSDFILPLASYGKNYYPEYTNAINILKSNIESLNNSTRIMIEKADERVADVKKQLEEARNMIEEVRSNIYHRFNEPVDREKVFEELDKIAEKLKN